MKRRLLNKMLSKKAETNVCVSSDSLFYYNDKIKETLEKQLPKRENNLGGYLGCIYGIKIIKVTKKRMIELLKLAS
jgi:hypothetical protein